MNDDIDDDASVQMLVDVIFEKQVLNVEEMMAQNPSIPIWLFTEDFIRSFKDVLCIKRVYFLKVWQTFFYVFYRRMLASHEKYLTHVMWVFRNQHKCSQNIFESFISVCALAKLLCDDTLQKTEVNFCNLIPDIIMVFYRCVLKTTFCSQRGFRQLVEYIHEHRYLTWNYSVSPDDPTTLVLENVENEKIMNEAKKYPVIVESNPDDHHRNYMASNVMAQEVLSTTSVQLPTLPSEPDLIARLVAYRKREKDERKRRAEAASTSETSNVALSGYSSSNSDSKSYAAKHQKNIVEYENIIQAVIRHNHSKSSSNEKAKNQIQEVIEPVLQHLKDSIKSLIKVLDEYDKE